MQFDCTEQSPQPSQTASLIKMRASGSVRSPRLRRRRVSAAQAGLVINQDREAGSFAQQPLHGIELVAVTHVHAGGQSGIFFISLVGDDHHAPRALRHDLIRDLRHSELALDRLSAGHGDRVVVENLVGDIDAGRCRGADRHETAVGVGAIAEILKDVLLAREWRLSDPIGAFAAHMRERGGLAPRHEQGHGVTAYAGHRAAALRQAGRCIVRASRAEERGAANADGRRRPALETFEPIDALRERFDVGPETFKPCRDGTRHQDRCQLAGARQERHRIFIGLAGHARTAGCIRIEKEPHQLVLDEAALFLDDENFFEPLGKSAQLRRLERPRQPHLVESNAERSGVTLVQSELRQRLADIEIGFSS